MLPSNNFKRLGVRLWQPLAGYIAGVAVVLALLLYRLGSLVPGFSLGEKVSIASSKSLEVIFNNPLFAPHELIKYLGLKAGHNGYIAMRLPSVIFGLAAVLLFFYIVNRWFNFRVAMITTILFATSSWFLTMSRIATPEVLMLGLLAPLAYSIWLPKHQRPLPTLILGAFVLTTMLHVPGFVWFAIAGVFWQRHSLAKVYKESKIPTLLILSACVILMVPMIVAVLTHKSVALAFVGLPQTMPASWLDIPKNLLLIPYHLVLSGPTNPATNLARLPLLDFFVAIMAIIGVYSYASHSKLRRSKLILACVVLGSILVSLGGMVSITILLPFVFLLVAGGLNFMIEQWFMVFPYNPLARNLATLLIFLAVGITSFYHLNRYFVAWPQAPATKVVYRHQPSKP